jgi:sugar phosphate isomerase/epimerase
MNARKLFAMDTWFVNSTGYYPLETRASMLSELGFDGMYFVCGLSPEHIERETEEFARLRAVSAGHKLELGAVFCPYDISLPPDAPGNARALHVAGNLPDCKTLDLALTAFGGKWSPGDASHDAAAERALLPLLDIAERDDFVVALYPHIYFWLEKADDALRLCQRIGHPRLRLNFCGMHWFSVDANPLFPLLERLLPHLHSVNLNGARKPNPAGLPCTIEPLGEGEMDNFAVLWKLHQLGFNGWFGLQGYSVGGDIYKKLADSLQTFRDYEARIEAHPEWSFSMNPKLQSNPQ